MYIKQIPSCTMEFTCMCKLESVLNVKVDTFPMLPKVIKAKPIYRMAPSYCAFTCGPESLSLHQRNMFPSRKGESFPVYPNISALHTSLPPFTRHNVSFIHGGTNTDRRVAALPACVISIQKVSLKVDNLRDTHSARHASHRQCLHRWCNCSHS